MNEMLDNKISFGYMRPKKPKIFWFIILLLILLIVLMIKVKVRDNYQTKGYVTCSDTCLITTYIPTNIDYQEIYLNNKKYNEKIVSQNLTVDKENIISYFELVLHSTNDFQDGEIIDVNFYYQKQRLIVKIKNLIF